MAAIERKPYMDRIDRLKQRVLKTKPEMDLENAIILTKGFQESEGQPLCIRKAYAFKKQCLEKTVKIWGDELIVGNAGSKQRGGILSVDTCWSVLDEELDTISTRPYDPFYLRPEDRKAFEEIIRPYWKGRSTYEQWLVQCPDFAATLRDCGALYINRKSVRGWGETTAGYSRVIKEGMEGIKAHIHKVLDTLDITRPGDYEKIEYLKAMELAADGISALGHRYARRESWQRQSRMRSAEKNCYRLQRPAIRFRKNRRVPSARRFSRCIFTRPVFSWSRMQQATTRDVWISIFTHFIRQISRLAV